jgi:alkylation response protein AidB-like acyl-CoA dehydrogenase
MAMPTAESVREEVRTWLDANWDPDLTVGEWWERLMASGYAAPTFPEEDFGRGYNRALANVVNEELAKAGAVGPPAGLGYLLAAPTIATHATREQKDHWLTRILNGTDAWCQLFSEPGAGSDLANVGTRAERDGDVWRVTGQKVWTSRGHYARWGFLVARSDPNVAKHAGITTFAVDMGAPGVEVRPLRQMNGDAHFTEVFLDDARVRDGDRIGAIGEGWRVALTCLSFERGAATTGSSGGLLDVERLIELARARGLLSDRVVRDAIARLVVDLRVMSLTIRRARDTARSGQPGPAGSGLKLRGSKTFRDYTNLAERILGADALTATEPWHTLFLTAPSLSIRGGTDEIQRNIVGERVLGLPEEPRLDRTLPFDQLPG